MNRLMYLAFIVFGTACIDVGSEDDELDDDGLASKNAAIRIVQHNIEKKDAVLDRTIQHAKNIDAHGIALQEVCPVQVERLKKMIPSSWSIGVGPGKKRSISGCELPDGTQDFPAIVVIWTGGKNGKVTDYPVLASPANAPGAMVCIQFERAKVPVHLCSAHLISADWVDPNTGTSYDGAAIRLEQTTKIKQIARDEWFGGSRNHFGIVAGDLNGQPNTPPLDKLYDAKLGGTGDFTEYNRSGGSRNGENTAHADGDGTPFSRKIDYVMFSTNRAPIDGPGVNIVKDGSDHDMVTSTVQMRK